MTVNVMPRRRLCGACLGLVLPLAVGCGTPARATDHPDGRWLRVEIVDRVSGRPLPVWRHGDERFVAGTPGARYAVRLTNRSGERLLAVVAIDGVNIVSGETAAVGQRGYALSPWGHAWLTGWRKSEREVAAFEFTALDESYAARTGRPGDVGVNGVAVFRERPQPLALEAAPDATPAAKAGAAPPGGDARAAAAPAPDARTPATPATADGPQGAQPAASARGSAGGAGTADREDAAQLRAAAGERLGTGHGAREASAAVTVPFERATAAPQEVLRIRYDSLENLVAAGIATRPLAWAARPRPFPADEGFVPDPDRP